MKNILKYILCCAFCVGVICATTTTVNAEETEENIICDSAFEIGDTIYYQCATKHDTYTKSANYSCTVDNSNLKICFYLEGGINSPTGYQLAGLNESSFTKLCSNPAYYTYTNNDGTFFNSSGTLFSVRPYEYHIRGGDNPLSTLYFRTNIPIFQSRSEAQEYVNGTRDINTAINYKKTMNNGSWVKPFEDIEINDSNMLVPKLSNVSHNGFTVTNNNGMYMLDVYVDSGIQDVQKYLDNSSDINNPLYSNSFGLVSNNTEAAYDGVSGIDMMSMFGVDNVSALQENLVDFFATYPSVLDYQNNTNYVYQRDDFTSTTPCFFDIWGKWLGKTYMFWRTNHDVLSSDVDLTAVNGVPLCYTHYRVRYYYYDENDGMHYGPWANVVYFSGGRVSSSAIFQDNNGNIVESTVDNGVQDENGNIGFTNAEILDLNNPNSLFAYIRSAINNVNATGNNFMTLFASVFSFIPTELQLALWLGVGTMILIGVIKALRG